MFLNIGSLHLFYPNIINTERLVLETKRFFCYFLDIINDDWQKNRRGNDRSNPIYADAQQLFLKNIPLNLSYMHLFVE